jgi:hypothetical protein
MLRLELAALHEDLDRFLEAPDAKHRDEAIAVVDPNQIVARATARVVFDPGWSDKRLVPVAPRTLERLQRIAKRLNEETGVRVEPMQLAAIRLETTADQIDAADLDRLVAVSRRGRDRSRK